ncbi:MAG TPA: hypothetical protein VHD62_05785 [Opitutaceae bacterium]|nr:hypothetical protein [Opitutaceae bacterium]
MKTRRWRRSFLLTLVGLALVGGGCTSLRQDRDVAQLRALAFDGASSVEVARVKGTTDEPAAFRGYRLTSSWRAAGAGATELARTLAALVQNDLSAATTPDAAGTERVSLHSFCFNPGFALRVQTARGRRDFLVCLECDEVQIFDAAGHVWQHHLEKSEAEKLAALLNT